MFVTPALVFKWKFIKKKTQTKTFAFFRSFLLGNLWCSCVFTATYILCPNNKAWILQSSPRKEIKLPRAVCKGCRVPANAQLCCWWVPRAPGLFLWGFVAFYIFVLHCCLGFFLMPIILCTSAMPEVLQGWLEANLGWGRMNAETEVRRWGGGRDTGEPQKCLQSCL